MVIRSWKDATPAVGHDAKIIWSIFRRRGSEGATYEEAPLEGLLSLTLHRIQPGASGDSHAHEDKEQVYYFTRGRGKMRVDGHLCEVREGDAVHLPPRTQHQMVNDSDDWVEHLIISADVPRHARG
ncbi:MAG: cupin domain-containing protein [Gemmatimonadota bacterium]